MPANIISILSAACFCMPGIMCEYMSIVIPICECPSRSDITFGNSPALSNRLAWVCRNVWKLTFRVARFAKVTK